MSKQPWPTRSWAWMLTFLNFQSNVHKPTVQEQVFSEKNLFLLLSFAQLYDNTLRRKI